MTDPDFCDDQAAPAVVNPPVEMSHEDLADVPWVRWLDEDSAFRLGLRPFPTIRGSELLPFERKRLIEAVSRGDAKAQLEIALLFAQNAAHETDQARADHFNRRANEWLDNASTGGSAEALYQLGKRHQAGLGVAVDLAAAASFFERSAALGHTNATYELGRAFLHGEGVPQDAERGAALLRHAADSYHVEAGYELARCYYTGKGVPVDKGKANYLLEWTASRGHPDALRAMEITKNYGPEQSAAWWVCEVWGKLDQVQAEEVARPQTMAFPPPQAFKETLVSPEHTQPDEEYEMVSTGKKWGLLLGALTGWVLLTWLIRHHNPGVSVPLMWAIFVSTCVVGLFVNWRQTRNRADGASRKAVTDQELNARALDEILAEESGIIDDAINYCILHVGCVALAFALSWVMWIFGTGFLSTSDMLWGANHPQVVDTIVHGDQVDHYENAPFDDHGNWVGMFRYGIYHLTGFEAPWFCCFLTGVAVTCAIGLMRVPIGFLDAALEGHTMTAKSVVLGAKAVTSALHAAAFGFSSLVATMGDFLGGLGTGGASSIIALVGWPYLQRGLTMYQTPFRYVLNLIYGGAIFTFVFPVASHAILGSIQNIENHEWGWLLWTLLLGYIIAIPFGLYLQAAWYQGYGIGLWLGSWVPLRGWKLRKIYRTPASICLFHHSAVRAAVGLNEE